MVESVAEQLAALGEELVGDLVERDAEVADLLEGPPRVSERLGRIGAEHVADRALALEGVEGGGGDGVDRVGADQAVDVEGRGPVRILRTRARPQDTLGPRALGGQGLPAIAGQRGAEAPVGLHGVRNGHPRQQRLESGLAVGVGRLGQLRRDALLDHRIDPAHEEAGHARDAAGLAARCDEALEAALVGEVDGLVVRDREEQGDVDVDAFTDQRLDGRQALGGGRDLDHQIGPTHGCPEATGLVDGGVGVVGEVGRDLEAHESVRTLALVVHGAQHVAAQLDVGDREPLEDGLGVGLALGTEGADGRVVVGGAGDGLLEDRRVRSDAANAVLFDEAPQLAREQEVAADEVVPDALPVLLYGARACRHFACWGLHEGGPRVGGLAGVLRVGPAPGGSRPRP